MRLPLWEHLCYQFIQVTARLFASLERPPLPTLPKIAAHSVTLFPSVWLIFKLLIMLIGLELCLMY